ncbi:MAG: hypothetical protein SGPRY_014106, partial [Prymnesium sp.]
MWQEYVCLRRRWRSDLGVRHDVWLARRHSRARVLRLRQAVLPLRTVAASSPTAGCGDIKSYAQRLHEAGLRGDQQATPCSNAICMLSIVQRV